MSRRRSQTPTIKDIAQACKVSPQTVSRVINKRHDVSQETRQAIEEVITRIGYRPSALARSLVQQRSYTLGVITAGLRYVGVSQTLNGITEECENSNYALFIKELPHFNTPDIVPVIESLMAHQVEGIIFAAPEINENVKLAQSQLPMNCQPIVFLKCQPNPNFYTISIDNYGGARKAVEYLFSVGRDRVGLISGPLEWLEARQRKQGWEDALQSKGMNSTRDQWVEGNWSSASGETSFLELLEKYPNMSALFCSNDQMALGALHIAYQKGIRIPEDIAVIGFDNLAESASFIPSLSTVTHPLRQLGILAVQTLMAHIEDRPVPISDRLTILETDLILRDTTPKP